MPEGSTVAGLLEILGSKHQIEFKLNDSVSTIEQHEVLMSESAEELDKVAPLLTVSLGLALRREGN